jgi:hypothetical protein
MACSLHHLYLPAASLQGKYSELSSQQAARTLETSSAGVFNVVDPKAAVYNFKNSFQGSNCVDVITSEFSSPYKHMHSTAQRIIVPA